MSNPAYDVYLPGREFCFTRHDLGAYWRLLSGMLPTVRCRLWLSDEERQAAHPPTLKFYKSIEDVPSEIWTEIVFDPDWEPEWETSPHGHWRIANPDLPSASVMRGGEVATNPRYVLPGHPLECIEKGNIFFRCKKGNREQMNMARRALRLVAKVATNTRQAIVEYPSLTVINVAEKGSDLWIGHDAARWMLEKPYRMTDYNPHWKRGTRPAG